MEAQSRSRWRHNLDQDGGTTMFFITEEAKELLKSCNSVLFYYNINIK